jgi:hypothetical protein
MVKRDYILPKGTNITNVYAGSTDTDCLIIDKKPVLKHWFWYEESAANPIKAAP